MLYKNPILIETYTVAKTIDKLRLSDFSAGTFTSIISRKGFKNAIKKGLVQIDGKIGFTGDYILGGEIITIYKDKETNYKPKIQIAIEVLFEDDYLAIVNKPAGIVVSGNKKWTLENALQGNLKASSQIDATHPEPIHRLDYPTSGAVLIGKTASVVQAANKLFEDRKIKKTYIAVTIKEMPSQGVLTSEIDNKSAKTIYKVVQTIPSPNYGFLNLVELKPHTGRKHQLRKHMSAIGNPIFGDLLYGLEGFTLKGKGLYLHAQSLKFKHPVTRENIYVEVERPKKFGKLFD